MCASIHSEFCRCVFSLTGHLLVGLGGLEPPTSPLSGARSNHLSYRPVVLSQEDVLAAWWSLSGSNRRPPACKAGALPAELIPRLYIRLADNLVGLVGLEPTTPALSTRCSNQLSYSPKCCSLSLLTVDKSGRLMNTPLTGPDLTVRVQL